MNKFLILFIIATLFVACSPKKTEVKPYQWPDVKAPVCEKKAFELKAHRDVRIDDYYWLNDYFKQGPDSSRVLDYLKAENAYCDTMLSQTKDLQVKLYDEMKARIKEKDESVPAFSNGYYYYTRMEEGKEYFLYCRKKGDLNASEEILLDVNKMAEGHGYFSATGFDVSPDNKLLAYGIDDVSRRQYKIFVKNLETGEIMSDVLTNTSGDPVWAGDNKTIFYVKNNAVTLLSEKIMRHIIGTPESADKVVYTEKDPSNYIAVWRTRSDKYIFITSQATLSSELRFIDASKPESDFKVFQPRIKDVLYSVDQHEGDFYILTNQNALNFKLMVTPVDKTEASNWKEVVAHRDDVLIESMDAFRDFLVVSERKEGLLRYNIMNLKTNTSYYLPFEEPAYMTYPGANADYNSSTFRYVYTSMTTPSTTYDYDMSSKKQKLMKQQEVLGGFSPKDYVTERVYATATDGSKVPISLVYKKGTKKDGSAPLLLYGYGSYGYSMDASFSSSRLSLLNRGFVYAIAHIRGGQEMGRAWYENGKMDHKMNTFTDFIACGEHLIAQKYTSQGHLYAMGGSAGGLLMGAIVNLKPELWNGIVAQVPFVDVITTMSDVSIPLTTNEYDEWGNPADKKMYEYMKTYSPYDNVAKKAYPAMLVTTGLHDSQVQYFEPAKWVARLREYKTDQNPILLHIDMEAGHGGASGRFKYLKEIALEDAFLFAMEGITE